QAEGLTSIWCSWAAVVSVLIFFQLVGWRNAERSDSGLEHPSAVAKGGDLFHP
ncbi:MAG: hypothetical protein QOH64_1360, partial [Acidimicrobiaceae bacterium]